MQALTQYFVDKGVKGIYVNGSSGECIYQSVAGRKTVPENGMKMAKGKLAVINHVACNSDQAVVDEAAQMILDAKQKYP